MSEYLLQHYEYVKSLSYEEIIDGRIAWDAYRVPLDYKSRVLRVNPQLSKEEFDAELMSPEPIKKFFYTYEGEPGEKMPIDIEVDKKINRRVQYIKKKLVEVRNKYTTIDTFDYFAEREADEEDRVKREKKYVWKSKDEIGDLRLITENGMRDLKSKVSKMRRGEEA